MDMSSPRLRKELPSPKYFASGMGDVCGDIMNLSFFSSFSVNTPTSAERMCRHSRLYLKLSRLFLSERSRSRLCHDLSFVADLSYSYFEASIISSGFES